MGIFFTVNKKFDVDARKAFFAELSTRLEYMSEDIDEDTSDEHFAEMIEIINELRAQCVGVRVDRICKDNENKNPVEVKF